jgi:Fe-S-cluster containining protein
MVDRHLQIKEINWSRDVYLPFLARLEALFSEMDSAYDEIAACYGFVCTGCPENCCLTRFYHHSVLEYLYIREGFNTLEPESQGQIIHRAIEATRITLENEKKEQPVRVMCPLNLKGLCVLYPYRPMICRLHGIPHELNRTGQKTDYGSGCHAFTQQCMEKPYITFDRTPFYAKMANLEKDLRRTIGFFQKVKMTVAEMIVSFYMP